MTRLLSPREEVLSLGLQSICIVVVILDRRNAFVLSHVEVIVEISPIRAHPRKRPAHAFLVSVDLGDRGTGDADKGRGARGQVVEGWDVVADEGAGRTASVPGGVEHEVVDDELAVGSEEVGEGNGGFLTGGGETGEDIRLGHFDDGEVAALSCERVASAGDMFLLFKEREAGGAVL